MCGIGVRIVRIGILSTLGEWYVPAQASYNFCLAPRPKNTFYDVESRLLSLGSKLVRGPITPQEERVLRNLMILCGKLANMCLILNLYNFKYYHPR